jgi:hypothetical protein
MERAATAVTGRWAAWSSRLCRLNTAAQQNSRRALVQQRVYPRRVWRLSLCFTGHVAKGKQQSEFAVDHLEVAHARSVDPDSRTGTSLGRHG